MDVGLGTNIDLFDPIVIGSAELWFVAFVLNSVGFWIARDLRCLCAAAVAGLGTVFLAARVNFGLSLTVSAALTFGIIVVGMAALAVLLYLDDAAQKRVPAVDLKPNEGGLLPLVSWLRDVRAGVPSNISAAVQRIADHVSALEALRVEMPGAQLPLDRVRSLVGKDLRDLVVRWKRVETATKMLPGKQTLGVDALAGGFGRIECALVAIREDVASAALNDLKVSERYLELKHGEGV